MAGKFDGRTKPHPVRISHINRQNVINKQPYPGEYAYDHRND
jgi:hypothetical protein